MGKKPSDYPKRLLKKDGYRRDIYTTSGELSLYYDPYGSETLRTSAFCEQQSMASRVVKVQNAGYEIVGKKKSTP